MTTRRKWTRRILFALLTVAVIYVAARFVGRAVSASRLEDELERARATGAPLTLADAVPAPVPDAENAAVVLQEAFALLVGEPRELWDHEDALQDDPHALTEDVARLFEAWVEKNAQALAKVEDALRRPRCQFDFDLADASDSVAKHVPGMQRVTRVLSARGSLQIRNGDVDGALRTSATIARLGRHERQFPTLIDVLVGMGIERIGLGIAHKALSAGAPTLRTARDLLEVLDARPPGETLVSVLHFERALGLYYFDGLEDDPAFEDEFMGPDEEIGLGSEVLRFLFPTTAHRLDKARFLRCAARALKLARRPYRETKAEWDVIAAKDKEPAWYDRLASPGTAAYRLTILSWEVHQVEVDLARIGLRVELHALEKGALPEALAELDIPGGTQDRFCEAPYVYRRKDGGYLIYSVGPNGLDEGGLETDNPFEEGDLVWRRKARAR